MGQAEPIDQDLRHEFDFTKAEIRSNPFPYYRSLLAAPPIFVEREIPWAVISRYADVTRVLTEHETFSSIRPSLPGTDIYDPFPGIPIVTFTDEPDHSRLRGVIASALTPQRVKSMAPKFREIIDDILDVQCKGKREVDAQKFVAQEIPIRVFGSLRGLSPAQCDKINELTFKAVAAAHASRGKQDPATLQGPIAAFIKELMGGTRKGQAGGEDPVSLAIAAHECGTINDSELFGMVMFSVVGGLTTTADSIGGTIYRMLAHPAVFDRVKSDRSLVTPLVEENLRFDGPAHVVPRTTKCDVEVGGVRIPKGTPMMVVLGAANRDPRKFANPDDFDITRSNVMEHIAFGVGIHFCTGAPLGRVVATIALERLIERFPRMRLQDGWTPSYIGGSFNRGLRSLPVLLD